VEEKTKLQTLAERIEQLATQINADQSNDLLGVTLKGTVLEVMRLSTPQTGLRLAPELMGKFLAILNDYDDVSEIERFLKSPGPGNFPLFYYIQRAVEDCLGFFTPRHYSKINSLIVGPILLSSIKGKKELPATAVVEEGLRHKFVSFNIQQMLCMSVSANHGFMRKTAEFLIDECGADIEKAGYGFTFLQKALAMIDTKDEESLDALKFYIARQNNPEKVREQVKPLYRKNFGFCEKDHGLFKPEYESHGISARVKYAIAREFLEDKIKFNPHYATITNNNNTVETVVIERSFKEICVAAAAQFRSPMQVAESTPEGAIKSSRVKQLLANYVKSDNNTAEIEAHIKDRRLDVEEERLLVAEATEMDPKLGRNIEKYIRYITEPVKASPMK